MAPATCSRLVGRLCEEAAARLAAGPAREEVRSIGADLRTPLRVAVAGRVKSGKSTLVNALLAQDVAPTAYGECTRAVTWFRHGFPPQARLVLREGGERQLALERGQRVPASLGVEPERLDRVEVDLSTAALREMTVIDTPGLASVNDELSGATRRALALGSPAAGDAEAGEAAGVSGRTAAAASQADALVFVVTGPTREDEVNALEDFRRHLGGMRASAVNTVLVLNKADQLAGADDGGDSLERACALAEDYRIRFSSLAATVIPTLGLVAETIEAGHLTEADAGVLGQIAALESSEKVRLLYSADWFRQKPAGAVAADARERLLGLLGLYGVRRCVEWMGQRSIGASALRSELARISGIAELRTLLSELFAGRADVLKAANALARLERLAARADAASAADRAWLAQQVERTRLDPAMQALATTWALAEVAGRGVDLPEDLVADLRRVALSASIEDKLGVEAGAPAPELREAAARGSDKWRAFANSGGRNEQRRVASVMYQQYAALWQLAEKSAVAS